MTTSLEIFGNIFKNPITSEAIKPHFLMNDLLMEHQLLKKPYTFKKKLMKNRKLHNLCFGIPVEFHSAINQRLIKVW